MSGNLVSFADLILERLRSELAVVDPAADARVHDKLGQLVDRMSTVKSLLISKGENMSTNLSYISGPDFSLGWKMHRLEEHLEEFFSKRFQRRKQLVKLRNVLRSIFFQKQPTLIFLEHMQGFVSIINYGISEVEETTVLCLSQKYEMLKVVFQEENECNVSVIPIISKLGIVKTTLAQFIYGRTWVQPKFESITWVRVYELCGRRRVRVKIDGHKYNKYYSELSFLTDELKDLLKKQTAGKRFLVVLEDSRSVEDEEYWRCLKELSSGGQSGSKVIIITSDEEAAEKMGTKPPFRWDSSSDQFDEDQFIDEFCEETRTPKHVISTWLASAISENDDRAWKVTATNTILDILQFNYGRYFWYRGSFERSNRNDDQLGEIEIDRSLFQSYINLPLHLKQCFEYCRLFPQDYEIDVQTLINLWMAQGFIKLSDDSSQCLEDVGREYFEVLLERGFFQKVDHDHLDHIFNSSVTRCKINYSMYNLLTILAGMTHVMLHPSDECNYIDGNVTHHVSFDFHLHSPRQIPKTLKYNSVMIRSILLPHQSSSKYEQGMIDPERILHMTKPQSTWDWRPGPVSDVIISEFRKLRALDLHDLGIKVVRSDIGKKLMHLRYLDLSRNAYIKALPATITKLQYLQTLKLSHCIELEELPSDIKNLVNLRSLEIDGCYNLAPMPRGFGQLTNLLVLPQFVANKDVQDSSSEYGKTGGLNELEKLNKLRGELQIKNLTPRKDVKAAALGEKKDLQMLVLDWDTDQSGVKASDYETQLRDLKLQSDLKGLTLHGYGGSELSSWLNLQRNLVKLVLRKCLKCEYLERLNHFPSLKVLILDEMPNLKFIDSVENPATGKPFFPELQELQLTELPQLEGWRKSNGDFSYDDKDFPSFSCLSKLSIQDCPKLRVMPLFPDLKDLMLDTTSWVPFKETMKSKGEGGNLPLMNLSLIGIRDFKKDEATEFYKWGKLERLRVLRLDFIMELEEMFELFRHATDLRELGISRCSIGSIPNWIGDLKSLGKLAILLCPNLKSLPVEISNLEKMKTLEIDDCPTLLQRCQRETGADWVKIYRIENIILGS